MQRTKIVVVVVQTVDLVIERHERSQSALFRIVC